MPQFMDFHDNLMLPSEAIEQIAADARPDEEAIRQHHAALGVSCGEVHRVDTLG